MIANTGSQTSRSATYRPPGPFRDWGPNGSGTRSCSRRLRGPVIRKCPP